MRQTIHFKLFAMVAMCSIFIVGASERVLKAPKGIKGGKSGKSSKGMWYEDDTVVNLVPKFKIKAGMTEQFVALLPDFFDLVKANEQDTCVHYGFVSRKRVFHIMYHASCSLPSPMF